jgi:Tfp pilus assembly protein PilF
MHQISKAVREHKRAVELDPNLAEAHLNLAYDYQLLHQPKAAQQEYRQACKLQQGFCKFVPAQ